MLKVIVFADHPGLLAIRLVLFLLTSSVAHAAEPTATDTAGQLKSSRWWADLAAGYVEAIEDPKLRNDAYNDLVYAQARVGDLQAASASAGNVTTPQLAVYSLTAVARRYHQQGDAAAASALLEQARSVALATKKAATSNFIYGHLIRDYVELDRVDDARSFADALPGPVHRNLGFRELASALAKQGKLDAALEIVTAKVSDHFENSKENALRDVAIACAREAHVENTQTVVDQLADVESRDHAYAKLVESLVERGRLTEAEAAAAQITSLVQRSKAQAAILKKWADGQEALAIATRLGQVESREEKIALYEELVEKLAAEERIVEAEQAIAELVEVVRESPRPADFSKFGRKDDSVAIALAKVNYLLTAKALANQGDDAAARQRIQWAAKVILALAPETGLNKGMLAIRLVLAQIDIGDLKGARSTVDDLEDSHRSMPAERLAVAYAEAGDVRAALDVARQIPRKASGRGLEIGSVAAALVRSGDRAAAKQLLAELLERAEEAPAYKPVGRAMIEAGRGADLQQWLPEMPRAVDRAYACLGAEEGLFKPETR